MLNFDESAYFWSLNDAEKQADQSYKSFKIREKIVQKVQTAPSIPLDDSFINTRNTLNSLEALTRLRKAETYGEKYSDSVIDRFIYGADEYEHAQHDCSVNKISLDLTIHTESSKGQPDEREICRSSYLTEIASILKNTTVDRKDSTSSYVNSCGKELKCENSISTRVGSNNLNSTTNVSSINPTQLVSDYWKPTLNLFCDVFFICTWLKVVFPLDASDRLYYNCVNPFH
jgi:hypothetical protein